MRILIVHAGEDREAAQRLRRHLGAARRRDVLPWTVDDIPPGSEWREALDQLVDRVTIVVALLSADFLASDLWDHEISRVRERRPELPIVPVLVRSVALEGTRFEGLQALPRSGQPIAAHALADAAWEEIARALLVEAGQPSGSSPARGPLDPAPALPFGEPRHDEDPAAPGGRRPPPPRGSEPGHMTGPGQASKLVQTGPGQASKLVQTGPGPASKLVQTGPGPAPRLEPPRSSEPALPKRLVEAARLGQLVPFAGAGVSMAVRSAHRDGPLFPSWAGLLETAAARLEADGFTDDAASVRGAMRRRKNPSYLEAARVARDSLGTAVWLEVLRGALDLSRQDALDTSLDLPRALWTLGAQLLVTTNHDRVLHWACPDRENLRSWSIEAAAEQIAMLRGGLRFPTVWHLHGIITDATSVILTPDGYNRLYGSDEPGVVAAGESRHQAALASLRMLLALRTTLFVGFSFDDATFAGQLEWLEATFHGAVGPHYVLVREAERERLASRIEGLPVVAIPYADHGAPLLALLHRLTRLAGAR